MLVFLTLYIFTIRQVAKFMGGDLKALSTYFLLLPSIFLTTTTLYDIFMLVLVFFSSLHHSKNGRYKILANLDSTFIVGVVSSILLSYWSSISITLFTFLESQILQSNTIKYMLLGLCNLYIMWNHSEHSIFVYFNTLSFFLWKKLKPRLFFRIQWHLSCALLLSALIPIIQKDILPQPIHHRLR